MQKCGYANMQTCRQAEMRTCGRAYMQICLQANMQRYGHADCGGTDMQRYEHTDLRRPGPHGSVGTKSARTNIKTLAIVPWNACIFKKSERCILDDNAEKVNSVSSFAVNYFGTVESWTPVKRRPLKWAEVAVRKSLIGRCFKCEIFIHPM